MAFDFLKNIISQKHILIVDDDKNILRIFGDLLQKRKYKVTTGSCFADLGDLEELPDVDLVLLDCFLNPPPSGPEIALRLRKAGIECPICFITAKNASIKEENELKALTHDTHFLHKPVSAVALLNKVSEII
ncbi:MAG: response regulator [Deltaproteobacteria bacterium]|nr:response regulator [Deltaproteobacteria bacterium]